VRGDTGLDGAFRVDAHQRHRIGHRGHRRCY
jgi:hypothetical protein